MHTIIAGGATDSDAADVTVSPVRSSSSPAVMTQTPPAICRMASLNVGASMLTGWFTIAFIARPTSSDGHAARHERSQRNRQEPRPKQARPIGRKRHGMRAAAQRPRQAANFEIAGEAKRRLLGADVVVANDLAVGQPPPDARGQQWRRRRRRAKCFRCVRSWLTSSGPESPGFRAAGPRSRRRRDGADRACRP